MMKRVIATVLRVIHMFTFNLIVSALLIFQFKGSQTLCMKSIFHCCWSPELVSEFLFFMIRATYSKV